MGHLGPHPRQINWLGSGGKIALSHMLNRQICFRHASSAVRSSATGVSASIPAIFHTQADPLLSRDSQQQEESSQDADSPPTEPTLSTIMLAIQDCKASLYLDSIYPHGLFTFEAGYLKPLG